jgi:hypothetical protein
MAKRPLLVVPAIAVVALIWVWLSARPDSGFHPDLSGRDRLVTNEYAHWNPHAADSLTSKDWDVTSGSLFIRSQAGWTGVPDKATPNATSSNGTGSSVFRMTSQRSDFGDVTVGLRLKNLRLIDNGRQPAAETDGIHVFLRWQDPTEVYVASLNRRDNLLVVKKKLHGGTENGGTYFTLGQTHYQPSLGSWQSFSVKISSTGSSLVTITVRLGERTLLTAVDDGSHGRLILKPGRVGLRGDNCEFELKDFQVH